MVWRGNGRCVAGAVGDVWLVVLQVAGGRGRWQVASGRWQVAGGRGRWPWQVAVVKLCTAKLCLENQNKTYRDQSYPKAFPQINKRESNFPCSLAQITPDNKQRFNTHSVSLARA